MTLSMKPYRFQQPPEHLTIDRYKKTAKHIQPHELKKYNYEEVEDDT